MYPVATLRGCPLYIPGWPMRGRGGVWQESRMTTGGKGLQVVGGTGASLAVRTPCRVLAEVVLMAGWSRSRLFPV